MEEESGGSHTTKQSCGTPLALQHSTSNVFFTTIENIGDISDNWKKCLFIFALYRNIVKIILFNTHHKLYTLCMSSPPRVVAHFVLFLYRKEYNLPCLHCLENNQRICMTQYYRKLFRNFSAMYRSARRVGFLQLRSCFAIERICNLYICSNTK